ncbi:MAG TPA: DUF411 domain-containing protein [Coleofasciculaceae cyanobacterium]
MIHLSNLQIRHRLQIGLVGLMAIALLWLTMTLSAAASKSLDITVYRDPNCSCCGGWIDHLTAQGFHPTTLITADMDALKQQQGVPADLASCHTAVIDGYVIEGHVPAADIKRLIAEQPDIAGIAVPGMPIGTPGMESGTQRDDFTVLSFDAQGNTAVYHPYSFPSDL